MLKNPIIKVHFHGVEVQIQHIQIVNINGTSTLIPIHEFQTYNKNVEHTIYEYVNLGYSTLCIKVLNT